jgi:N-acylneuraminate cytidylyltransferase
MVVFDFDGVFTDNKVYVDQDGAEAVVCDRGDGMGIALLRERGVRAMVLSTEVNPIVSARCRKLKLPTQQGLEDKARALAGVARENGLDLNRVVYVGNDINDLACMKLAGFAVAVADAHPSVLDVADLVLTRTGGHGAVREICDLILEHVNRENLR